MMNTLEDLRKSPLYRQARISLEHAAQEEDTEKHLFETWSVLLALEDHIDSVMAESHLESLVTKSVKTVSVQRGN